MDKAFSDIGKCIVIECPVDKPRYVFERACVKEHDLNDFTVIKAIQIIHISNMPDFRYNPSPPLSHGMKMDLKKGWLRLNVMTVLW